MILSRHLLALTILMLALWYVPAASATTTCNATMSGWTFVVNSAGNTDVQSSVSYTCNTSTSISWRNRATVKMCLAIGPGSVPASTIGNRLLANSYNENLQFQIYRDAARTQVLGNSAANPAYLEVTVEYPLQGSVFGLGASGSTTGNIPIYARIPAQSGIAAGTYTSTFGNTTLRYRYRDLAYSQSDPVSCETAGEQGNPSTFSFSTTATVPNVCTIDTAGDMDFGSILAIQTGLIERTSTIRLTCTRRTAWQIGLSEGVNASGGSRRMAGPGGQFITYDLYRSAQWDRWGTALNNNTVAGTGDGTSQPVTVHGRILNQPLTRAGSYRDTITVIVTY